MNQTERKRVQRAISMRYFWRFVLQVAILTAGMGLATVLAIAILGMYVWKWNDPLYQFFSFIQRYYAIFFAIGWIAGALVILIIQWRSAAKSMVTLCDTIGQLANAPELPIQLPNNLRELQGLLQLVQMDTVRNRRLAAEAEQRKNDLVVYLAHDLKTPLTSVLGYLTLLRDEEEISPELREKYLSIATDKAQRLEDLINEFFDITRFSLKGLTLEPSRLNFSRMLEQVADEFRPLLADKNLELVLDIQPDIVITADAGKLERVVDNLMRNAISYSWRDSPVRVRASQTGDGVLLQVQNRGDDIPPHKLNHIFEQFYRVDSARSGQEGGAGLGLAIAREIVELHKGSLRVQSQDNDICFTMALPVAPVGETVRFYAMPGSVSPD